MTRLARIIQIAVVLVPVVAGSAGAQQLGPREVYVGSRVRVFAPDLRSDRYVGRVDSLDNQAMVLDTAGTRIRLGLDMGPVLVDQYRLVTIRLSSIREIEVSGGRTTRGATIRGIVVGGLLGGVLWGLGNLPEVNPGAADFVKGFPAGAVVGGVLGGALGYALGGERWYGAAVPR